MSGMPSPVVKQSPCPTARSSFFRGVKLGLPIFLGYVPVGAAFGVLATTQGFTALQAVVNSATALAGAGQFIGLSLMHAGASIVTVLLATTIVNLRYVLFGATLSTHLQATPLAGQAALAFSLTDETFAVNIDDQRRGNATGLSMAGVGAISWVGWVSGTLLGATASSLIGDPYRFGVAFAMPAMFTALLVAQADDRRHITIAVVAAVLAVVFALLLPGKWYIVAASVSAAGIGAAVYK
ncbi:MAG: branched-chain amino acid ABC transporter permease [Actinobacteria bacterium HGW-Actinobacteria-6]|nr:MAG: branched-chain amino acid ABC transporter permease [Actinobacteria bacterium HGW-Actinobacteria-6]